MQLYDAIGDVVDPAQPINFTFQPNVGLVSAWQCLPYGITSRGSIWRDSNPKSGNHGTLTNGPTWSGDAPPGGWGSLAFDGTDDLTDANDAGFPSGTADCTFVIRFKILALSGNYRALASYGRPGNASGGSNLQQRIFLLTNFTTPGSEWKFAYSSYGDLAFGNTTIATDVWYRCYCVISGGGNLSFYVNGQADGTGSSSLNTVLNGHCALGCRWDGDSGQTEHSNIRVQSAFILNRALSASEIAQLDADLLQFSPRGLQRIPRVTWFVPAAAEEFVFQSLVSPEIPRQRLSRVVAY